MHEIVLVGEAVAGQSAKARAMLESLINSVNKSTLDIAELLYQVKANGYYEPFTTFKEYTDTLNIKARKAQYLTKIVECFAAVGIDRKDYEPLGIAKLREISSLDPKEDWTNPDTGAVTPMKEFIIGFAEKGEEIELEDLKKHVRTLKGFVGENDLVWLNVCLKRAALESTVRPALDKMKALIGSVGKDDEGVSQDASDGSALEAMAIEVLNDETLAGQGQMIVDDPFGGVNPDDDTTIYGMPINPSEED